MEGHLFVVHGDLTRLDSDAVVLPCDEAGNVSNVWEPFLPTHLFEPGPWGRRLVGASLDDRSCVSLGGVDDRQVILVATAGETRGLHVDQLVGRVLGAVLMAAGTAQRHRNRQLPLIALPLVGTGAGGLEHLRGLVVERLVPALSGLARERGVDVALVLNDRRDYAAVQAARGALEAHGPSQWHGLTEGQRERADLIGRMAAERQLSLFVGSGASVPLGLPNWRQLLERMAEHVRPEYAMPPEADLRDEAAGFRWLMGEEYEPFMKGIFDLDRHALGHALLAALNVRQMVTTNYDRCLELALDGIYGESYEVMTRNLATGRSPWLLKLHGDIRAPQSLVLTRSEYERLADEGRALHGVVESLMLTSHVLFVGYSLVDHDFQSVALGVKQVRDQATDFDERTPSGTALALLPESVDADRWQGEVDVFPMSDSSDVVVAARTLEVFLDRVAWASLQTGELAAEYLLDPRFEAGSTEADTVLRDALMGLLRVRHEGASDSAAWPKVCRLLISLGARMEEPSPRDRP